MGVYIKGMKMSENCCDCLLKEESTFLQGMGNIVHCGWVCGVTHEPISEQGFYSGRLLKCPIVEVPEPHGRLIDENYVIELLSKGWKLSVYPNATNVHGLKGVIEAEGE